MSHPSAPAGAKAELRRVMLERRRALHAAQGTAAAEAVQAQVLAALPVAGKKIAGYWPLGHEMDCRPVLTALHAARADVALPVVAGQGQVLVFRAWHPDEVLESGPFGTAHPPARAAIVQPEVLLVPLLAFDRKGYRLGYGAGFYDRTLGALRLQRPVVAIGLAYAGQEVDQVPTDANDQALDAIVTETGTLWFNDSVRQSAR